MRHLRKTLTTTATPASGDRPEVTALRLTVDRRRRAVGDEAHRLGAGREEPWGARIPSSAEAA